MSDYISKSAIVDRLSEEAKRLAEKAIHSKGQAVDYYTGMKTGMAKAAILVNGMLTGEPTVDAEWMLKHGIIPDADFPAIDAVPVVRCKDCRWKEQEQPGMVYCPATVGGWVDEDWFCKGGERSEE